MSHFLAIRFGSEKTIAEDNRKEEGQGGGRGPGKASNATPTATRDSDKGKLKREVKFSAKLRYKTD